MSVVVGTPYYVAPEILKGKYGMKCDMWSLGVLLYVMLSGDFPFKGETSTEIYESINSKKYSLEGKEWKRVSSAAKDLLGKLLVWDPSKRISA